MPKFEGIFFIADEKINAFMHAGGLKEEGEYYCESIKVKFETSKKINKEYLMYFINFSARTEEKNKIIAIYYKNKIYAHDTVKMIRDGEKLFLVN